jgi:hypothetical protein
VNLSAETAALVPPGVFTLTSRVPADCAGDVATISVLDFSANIADTEPNRTVDAPVNPVPVIVTEVPPEVGPADGETNVTLGADT